MLSSMETPMGITVIGPQGQPLRIQRIHPAFWAGKEILNQDLPATQLWQKLQDLVTNPLQALVSWCAKFGVSLADGGETFKLQNRTLNRAAWLPLLQRCQAAAGSPLPALLLAEKMGELAVVADIGKSCFHLQVLADGTQKIGIVKLAMLPDEVRVGDLAGTDGIGETACLVSYDNFNVKLDGCVEPVRGMVLARFDPHLVSQAHDILTEPVILGFNQTYRCQEGSAEGWLEDLSFDSLSAARRNAKEIQDSGAEARIINRITDSVVSLS